MNPHPFLRRLGSVIAAASVLFVTTAFADDYRWVGGVDSSWHTAGNWQVLDGEDWVAAGAAPSAITDRVFLNEAAPDTEGGQTISISSSVNISQLLVTATGERSFNLIQGHEDGLLRIRNTSDAILMDSSSTQNLTLGVATRLDSLAAPNIRNSSTSGGTIIVDAEFSARRHDNNNTTILTYNGVNQTYTGLEVRQQIIGNRFTNINAILLSAENPSGSLLPTLSSPRAVKVSGDVELGTIWFIVNSTYENPVSTFQIVGGGENDVTIRAGGINRGSSSSYNSGVIGLLAPTDGSTGALILSAASLFQGAVDRPVPRISLANNTFLDLRGNQELPVAINQAGLIFGEGGLRKTETGTSDIGAANTYTGGTLIEVGSLRLVGDEIPLTVSGSGFSEETDFYAGSLGPGLLTVREGASFNLNSLTQTLAGLRNDVYMDNDVEVESGGSIALGTGGALTLNTVLDSEFDGVISGSGTVTKEGEGSQTFTSAQTFSGTLTIYDGTFRLADAGAVTTADIAVANGIFDISDITAGSYTIGAAQVLSGSGTIVADGKTLVVEGSLAPGNSAGQLVISGGTLDISSVADLFFELGSLSDSILLTDGAGLTIGTLNFSDFTFLDIEGFGAGTYTLISGWDAFSGELGDVNGEIGGFDSTLFLDGNSLNLQVIPEPGMMALLAGLGVMTVVILRRRRG